MSNKKTYLCDLGGTHVRLAMLGAQEPEGIKDYIIADWPNMAAVMSDYALNYTACDFYMAHTGHVRNGRLDLGYKDTNPWSFNLSDLSTHFAMNKIIHVNDLAACAYAGLDRAHFAFDTLTPDCASQDGACVMIGIGTGAGHAFMTQGTHIVHETYGGHFPLSAVNDRQREILKIIETNLEAERTMIVEDILSGAGLFRIYDALHQIKGTKIVAKTIYDLIPQLDNDPVVRQATSVFSEFLGLYAHILCNVTHSYGGVYLCGGVTRRLVRAGLLDNEFLIKQFHQNMVPVVMNSLKSTPIYVAVDEYTALHGLSVYARMKDIS